MRVVRNSSKGTSTPSAICRPVSWKRKIVKAGKVTVSATCTTMMAVHTPPKRIPPPPAVPCFNRAERSRVAFSPGTMPATAAATIARTAA
jgi:hypothetical protein